jgi:hypothetical protein
MKLREDARLGEVVSKKNRQADDFRLPAFGKLCFVLARHMVDEVPTDVVAGAFVRRPGIPEPHHQPKRALQG